MRGRVFAGLCNFFALGVGFGGGWLGGVRWSGGIGRGERFCGGLFGGTLWRLLEGGVLEWSCADGITKGERTRSRESWMTPVPSIYDRRDIAMQMSAAEVVSVFSLIGLRLNG